MENLKREDRTSRESGRQVSAPRREQQLYRPSGELEFSPAEFFSNPFSAMRRMHDQMDRIFADAFSQQAGSSAMGGLGSWSPAMEVTEKDNQLSICAELPGLKPEDVKVEVTEDALVIQGERKQHRDERHEGRYHSERQYGRFLRTVPLPEGADAEHAKAEFRDGELRVTVPVNRPESKRRSIPIEGGGPTNKQG